MRAWTEISRDFRRFVARRGVEKVAASIPADRVTVYRIISGRTRQPSLAVRASIERLLRQAEERKHDTCH